MANTAGFASCLTGFAKKPKVAPVASSSAAPSASAAAATPPPPAPPKPAALPSFKRAEKKPDPTPASSSNTFQDARIALLSKKKAAAAAPAPGVAVKPRKTVRWAEGDALEKIRLIEKAVYGDEDGQEIDRPDIVRSAASALLRPVVLTDADVVFSVPSQDSSENARMMTEQEAQALSHDYHELDDLEEEIDWYEPLSKRPR
jgi:hypothetical protein